MRVRIIEPVAGHADERYNLGDHSFRAGEVIELDDELAAAWIESGRAAVPEPEPPAAEESPAGEVKAEHATHKKAPARHAGK